MASPTTIDELCAFIESTRQPFTRDGDTIRSSGYLDLSSLTSLPENTTFNVGWYLDLSSLTSLPENTTFNVGGYLDLRSMTSLPENTTFNVGGYLDLRSMTSLPENTTFNVGGYLDLRSMTSEIQTYKGQLVRLRAIDGYCMRLIRSRVVGGVKLWSAAYFKGDLENDKRCFVAQSNETYAHGDTAEQALRDLRFKIAERDFDLDEMVKEIRRRGTVRFDDYRLITGACESGLRYGLEQRGVNPNTEELPLETALELCRNGYGGERFRAAFGL